MNFHLPAFVCYPKADLVSLQAASLLQEDTYHTGSCVLPTSALSAVGTFMTFYDSFGKITILNIICRVAVARFTDDICAFTPATPVLYLATLHGSRLT